MLRFLRSPPIALPYSSRGCFHSSTARFPDNLCDRLANVSCQALAGTTGRGKTVEEAGVPIASGLLR